MLVIGTELVATVHSRVAHRLVGAWPLEIRPMPMKFEKMGQSVQWHELRTNDPELMWLRGMLTQAAQLIDL
ncbi:hypothetical protein D3C81_1909270 [compost metagenome]